MKALRIKSGSCVVRVFQSRSGHYVRFELRWTDHHGRKRRVKHSQRAVALAEARRIVADLARGHHHSELTLADLASFRAGINNLFGTGKTLETATAEYAECHRLLLSSLSAGGEGRGEVAVPSLRELAQCWLSHRATDSAIAGDLSALVETFLLELETRGLSLRHREDLRARLRTFAKAFPGPVRNVTAASVQTWILGLKVAPRTRNNYLSAVQTFFADAALSRHPAAPAIRLIKPSIVGEIAIQIWRVAEMEKLLTTAARFDPALVPILALGAFAKLRVSESAGVHASDIRLDDCQMRLRRGKTGSRLIPLPENCVAWLRAYAPADGPLWPKSIDALNAHFRALARRCEFAWRPNALRKSATTYALLLSADYAAVSIAAGNSPRMLQRHYIDPSLATKADAEKWFALLPPASRERVIVPLSFEK